MLDVLRWLVLAATLLIFCQLILGATMRGQHAGLAIPDFPPPTANSGRTRVLTPSRITTPSAWTSFPKARSPPFKSFCRWSIASSRWSSAFWWRRVRGRRGVQLGGKQSAVEARGLLARVDSRPDRPRRGDDLDEQGRRRGDAARDGRRAFARDRRALVHYCFWPTASGQPEIAPARTIPGVFGAAPSSAANK